MNFQINQQLLSGWGFSVNRRFERVAQQNRKTAVEVFTIRRRGSRRRYAASPRVARRLRLPPTRVPPASAYEMTRACDESAAR